MAMMSNKAKISEALEMRTSSRSTGGGTIDATRGESRLRRQRRPSSRLRKTDAGNATVTETVEQLISVVADEAEQCERLIRLMSCQQEFLILGGTRSIEANVRELRTALCRSCDLQCQRQQLVDTIAKGARFTGGKRELAQIVGTVSIDYGRCLSELHASIKKTIRRLCKTKEQNRIFIERSLGNISEFIQCAKSGRRPGPLESSEPLVCGESGLANE